MKLEKNQLRGIVILAICLIVFNILAFVIPFPRTGLFWLAWVFTNIAILAQAPIFIIAFRNGETTRSKFYGVPIARIGIIYLVIQLIAGFGAMGLAFVPKMPVWPFVIVFLLILAAAAIGLIATDATRDEIERQDAVLKKDVSKMRGLQSLGSSLLSQCDDPAVSAEVEKLAEQLRYSDPVSSDACAESEKELSNLMEELQRAIMEGDNAGAVGLAKRAQATLAERNRICKLNKSNS